MSVDAYLRLMKTLDDAWNAQDWATFRARHAPDVVVSWPGGAAPTRGIAAHEAESRAFFTTFPDNRLDNDPYTIQFGQGDWTCSVARFTGHMGGSMTAPDGTVIPPPTSPSSSTSTPSPAGPVTRSWRSASCTTWSAS